MILSLLAAAGGPERPTLPASCGRWLAEIVDPRGEAPSLFAQVGAADLLTKLVNGSKQGEVRMVFPDGELEADVERVGGTVEMTHLEYVRKLELDDAKFGPVRVTLQERTPGVLRPRSIRTIRRAEVRAEALLAAVLDAGSVQNLLLRLTLSSRPVVERFTPEEPPAWMNPRLERALDAYVNTAEAALIISIDPLASAITLQGRHLNLRTHFDRARTRLERLTLDLYDGEVQLKLDVIFEKS